MSSYRWICLVGCLSFVFITCSAFVGHTMLVSPFGDQKLLKIDERYDTLVIGASHAATGLDPSKMENTISVARSGEPMLMTYYKAKALLEVNPHISTVVLAYSPLHISKYQDYKLFNGSAEARVFAMDYYHFFSDARSPFIKTFSGDYIIAFFKHKLGLPIGYMQDLKFLKNYYSRSLQLNDLSHSPGYSRADGSHLEEDLLDEKTHYYFYGEDDQEGVSEAAIFAIRELAAYTKESSVSLVLVTTPVYSGFSDRVPDFYRERFDEVTNELLLNNAHITYRDFSELDYPANHFFDGDHLNHLGAERFSAYLKDNLQLITFD